MIRLTLDDLLNYGRVGPLALGDPMSKIDAIEGLAAGLDGVSRDGDGSLIGAYYRFGDFEIHCSRMDPARGLEIVLFVLCPGQSEGIVQGDGVFDIECRGVLYLQKIDDVLDKLRDFSISRSARRVPPEMQSYQVGSFGIALFVDEDDSTTVFTQFEVTKLRDNPADSSVHG